jgi:hypothetical protein
LEFRAFLGQDRSLDGTDLKADSAVDAGVEIDPVEIGTLLVFAVALIDASHGAGVDAIGNAFAHISNDGVSHGDQSANGRILEIKPIELQ